MSRPRPVKTASCRERVGGETPDGTRRGRRRADLDHDRPRGRLVTHHRHPPGHVADSGLARTRSPRGARHRRWRPWSRSSMRPVAGNRRRRPGSPVACSRPGSPTLTRLEVDGFKTCSACTLISARSHAGSLWCAHHRRPTSLHTADPQACTLAEAPSTAHHGDTGKHGETRRSMQEVDNETRDSRPGNEENCQAKERTSACGRPAGSSPPRHHASALADHHGDHTLPAAHGRRDPCQAGAASTVDSDDYSRRTSNPDSAMAGGARHRPVTEQARIGARSAKVRSTSPARAVIHDLSYVARWCRRQIRPEVAGTGYATFTEWGPNHVSTGSRRTTSQATRSI
jgi:hypothetical protein